MTSDDEVWSETVPTKPGYYWVRHKQFRRNQQIYELGTDGYWPGLQCTQREFIAQCEFGPRIPSAETIHAQQRELERLRATLKTIMEDFDCDSDAHRYGTACRCCIAKEALGITLSETETEAGE